jgi:heme-degrading monooxygenase HmoA
MFARVTIAEVPAEKLEEGITLVQEAQPEIQREAGFQGMYLLVNRTSGKTISISLWETEAAMQASSDEFYTIRNEAIEETGAQTTTEVYEVALQP